MFRCTASVLTHNAKTVSVINHNTELVLLLECCDLIKDSKCAGHTEYSLGNKKHTTTTRFSLFTSLCQNSLAVVDVIMAEFVFASDVQTNTVKKTSVVFCIIDRYGYENNL